MLALPAPRAETFPGKVIAMPPPRRMSNTWPAGPAPVAAVAFLLARRLD